MVQFKVTNYPTKICSHIGTLTENEKKLYLSECSNTKTKSIPAVLKVKIGPVLEGLNQCELETVLTNILPYSFSHSSHSRK